ncbi:MAG: hypothetical protein GQ557_01615, partial [Mycoplasmataceae bacterium]|nr:hypothetical protein [Mycoplasmataceae bacterium]
MLNYKTLDNQNVYDFSSHVSAADSEIIFIINNNEVFEIHNDQIINNTPIFGFENGWSLDTNSNNFAIQKDDVNKLNITDDGKLSIYGNIEANQPDIYDIGTTLSPFNNIYTNNIYSTNIIADSITINSDITLPSIINVSTINSDNINNSNNISTGSIITNNINGNNIDISSSSLTNNSVFTSNGIISNEYLYLFESDGVRYSGLYNDKINDSLIISNSISGALTPIINSLVIDSNNNIGYNTVP